MRAGQKIALLGRRGAADIGQQIGFNLAHPKPELGNQQIIIGKLSLFTYFFLNFGA